jgi:DNA-binding CsgD family transcriptional regulator
LAEVRQSNVLLEREPELKRLRDAVSRAAAGDGGLVVIGGPAGIGKTALLRAAATMAEQAGMRTLRAKGSDLEQEFAFGVVRQLFEGPVANAGPEERATLLAGAAQLAGPLFDPGPAPVLAPAPALATPAPEASWDGATQPADRRFTLVHSLYWLTSNISRTAPITFVVDDCHWADAPSMRFLAYVNGRCEQLGALVILTVRDGEPSIAQELLVALRADPRATLIEPAWLSGEAVGTLVRSVLGADADPEFCAACAAASAGNPFLVRELLAELEVEGVEPVAANLSRVESVRIESVSRAVVARLNRLGTDSRNLARAVAVLENASLRQASTLAGIAAPSARRAADRLISAQILAPAASLAFVHPLVRWAVYERIPAAALADGHRRAGLMLAAEGARSTRVGAHLMRGEPAGDGTVVALLRDAARDALADGAPDTAVRLLRRSLSEPPEPVMRGTVLAELGEAEALARDPAAAAHLTEALALLDDQPSRARLTCALSELLVWDGRPGDAHALDMQVLKEFGPDAPASLRAVLETIAAAAASVDGRLARELEFRLGALRELAAAAGPAGRGLLVFDACWQAVRGPYTGDWRGLLDAGLDGGRLVAEEPFGPQMARYAIAALVLADEGGWARDQIASVRADTLSRGSINAHVAGLTWSALLALREGQVATAEVEARATLELAGRHELGWAKIWLAVILGQALLERGALSAAGDVLARVPEQVASPTAASAHALFALGRLRLEEGRMAEAAAALRSAGQRAIVDNPNSFPWRSTLALALTTAEPDAARALAAEELESARRFGQPRGIGVALRACGILRGGAEGIALLAEAADVLRASPARLELARTLYHLGAAQRRAGQRSAARQPLREVLSLAQECGASLLAARVHEEIAATGVHLRRDHLSGPEALTPSERRVAELAAGGLTNREISQTLYVTVKTVGTHLGHIYDKLGLEGPEARERLAAMLALGRAPDARAGPGSPAAAALPTGPPAAPPAAPQTAPPKGQPAGPAPAGPPTGPRRSRSSPRPARTLDGAQRG